MLKDDAVQTSPAVVLQIGGIAEGRRKLVAGQQLQRLTKAGQQYGIAGAGCVRSAFNVEKRNAGCACALPRFKIIQKMVQSPERIAGPRPVVAQLQGVERGIDG